MSFIVTPMHNETRGGKDEPIPRWIEDLATSTNMEAFLALEHFTVNSR